MHLTENEIKFFYELWYRLIYGINKKHRIVSKFKKPIYGERVNEGLNGGA